MKSILRMGKPIVIMMLLLPLMNREALAQSKDEKAVAEAVEMLRKAMIKADKDQLEKLTSDDLTYGHSNGQVQNKAQFVDGIVSGKSVFVSIELIDQTIKIVENTAIVRHALRAATNDLGKPGMIRLSVLLVWIKQERQWKLLTRQAVKI